MTARSRNIPHAESHHVRLRGRPALLPGEYTTLVGATVRRLPTAEPCPLCREPLLHLETRGALRVLQAVSPPVADVHHVLAERVPETHRVLRCEACAVIFTAPANADSETWQAGVGGSKVHDPYASQTAPGGTCA